MNCLDFPCVNYSRLIAFGKKGKIKHTEKLAILQYGVVALMLIYVPSVFIMINMVIKIHFGSVIVVLCIIWYLL